MSCSPFASYKVTLPGTGFDNEKGGESVRICQKSEEMGENCDPGRKLREGNENWASPVKIGRVGKSVDLLCPHVAQSIGVTHSDLLFLLVHIYCSGTTSYPWHHFLSYLQEHCLLSWSSNGCFSQVILDPMF